MTLKTAAIGMALLFSTAAIAGAQAVPPSPTLPDTLAGAPAPRSAEYARLQSRLQHGWNTWDTNTIAGQVLLPEGLEIALSLKSNHTQSGDARLSSILIGRKDKGAEAVTPGPHSFDGSYSSFEVAWGGAKLNVQAGHAGDDLVLLVTPLAYDPHVHVALSALFSVNFLWNRPGHVERQQDRIVASGPAGEIPFYLAGKDSHDVYNDLKGPYFSADLTGPVGVSTGKPRTLDEIKTVLDGQRERFQRAHQANPDVAPLLEAIETSIGWDTVYEPHAGRVISPVSRLWNIRFGGYVLFDWDTFFAATLAATGSRDLAYANVLEILNEMTPDGFVPNYGRAGGWRSFDRSEPPIGAITVMGLYRQFHDRWLLEDSFDRLLRWNRWWAEHRDIQGYLAWGSNGHTNPTNPDALGGTQQGAKWESGLDNGPAFDEARFNRDAQVLDMADIGLMSMYVADANSLAEMADILGRTKDAAWLRHSAQKYSAKLATLWSPDAHIFLNRDLRAGKFSTRLAPTNFYPLLAGTATAEQVDDMLNRHFFNPEEFGGDRILPSIARNDPAFKDQNYWRGRIWGPMNYLVYLGLCNYSSPTTVRARQELARKSFDLFLVEWKTKRHVHENYSATMDDSDTVPNSDPFYHWGALMGLMQYNELNRNNGSASAPAK